MRAATKMWLPPPPYALAAKNGPKVFHHACQPYLARPLSAEVLVELRVALNDAIAEHYRNGYRAQRQVEIDMEEVSP